MSHDIDMKLGPVTKLERGTWQRQKKIDNDIMSVLSTLTSLSFFHFIANFAAIRKPNSGYIAY